MAGKTTAGIDEMLDAIVNASSELETQAFYDHITSSAARITRAHSSVLVLRDGESDVTMYVSAFNLPPTLRGRKIDLQKESLAAQVIKSGRPIFINDYENYARQVDVLSPYRFGAVVGVPISWDGETLGSLNVHFVRGDVAPNDTAAILNMLAQLVGVRAALGRAQLRYQASQALAAMFRRRQASEAPQYCVAEIRKYFPGVEVLLVAKDSSGNIVRAGSISLLPEDVVQEINQEILTTASSVELNSLREGPTRDVAAVGFPIWNRKVVVGGVIFAGGKEQFGPAMLPVLSLLAEGLSLVAHTYGSEAGGRGIQREAAGRSLAEAAVALSHAYADLAHIQQVGVIVYDRKTRLVLHASGGYGQGTLPKLESFTGPCIVQGEDRDFACIGIDERHVALLSGYAETDRQIQMVAFNEGELKEQIDGLRSAIQHATLKSESLVMRIMSQLGKQIEERPSIDQWLHTLAVGFGHGLQVAIVDAAGAMVGGDPSVYRLFPRGVSRREVEGVLQGDKFLYSYPAVHGGVYRGAVLFSIAVDALEELPMAGMEPVLPWLALGLSTARDHDGRVRRAVQHDFLRRVIGGQAPVDILRHTLGNAAAYSVWALKPQRDGDSWNLLDHFETVYGDDRAVMGTVVKDEVIIFDGREGPDGFGKMFRDVNFEIYAGQSSRKESLAKINDAYREAVRACSIAREIGAQNVVRFDDLGVLSLMGAEEDSTLAENFLRRWLGKLIDQKKDGRMLIETLDVYLQSNCNVVEAAKKMYLHPNTVKYRIKKVRDLSNLDLGSTEVQANLYFACRLYRLTVARDDSSEVRYQEIGK